MMDNVTKDDELAGLLSHPLCWVFWSVQWELANLDLHYGQWEALNYIIDKNGN
jgi:hypothetical protein